MEMGRRDKIALLAAGVALVIFASFKFAVFPVWDTLQEKRANLLIEEKRLEKYRAVATTVGMRSAEAATMEEKLREAESGLLVNTTVPLASAELQEIVKQVTVANGIEVSSSQFLSAKPLGAEYLQVPVGLQFQCRLDQLVNFLENAAANSKSLAVSRLMIQPSPGKEKLVVVNLHIAGIMRDPSKKASTR